MTALDYFVQVYDGLDIGMAGAWMAESEQLSLPPYPEYAVRGGIGEDTPMFSLLDG